MTYSRSTALAIGCRRLDVFVVAERHGEELAHPACEHASMLQGSRRTSDSLTTSIAKVEEARDVARRKRYETATETIR